MNLYNPRRDQARQFLFDAWAKFKQAAVLTDLEKIAVEVLQMHPEYHAIYNAPEQYLQQAYFPEMGLTNPFLHISLHLSVIEQISIDQPAGIKAMHSTLREKHGDAHLAYHDMMDCLAEILWQAQRDSTGPDGQHYLQLLQQKVQA